eukprot:806018-Pyramimonas_sp.AAC.1
MASNPPGGAPGATPRQLVCFCLSSLGCSSFRVRSESDQTSNQKNKEREKEGRGQETTPNTIQETTLANQRRDESINPNLLHHTSEGAALLPALESKTGAVLEALRAGT